jgi:hypothetical protein
MKNVFTRDTQKHTHKDEHLHTDTHTKWGGGLLERLILHLGQKSAVVKREVHTHTV